MTRDDIAFAQKGRKDANSPPFNSRLHEGIRERHDCC